MREQSTAYPQLDMKDIGIVGLPYSGKSTLFTALTRSGAAGGRSNQAVVEVPDPRLGVLAEMEKSKKVVAAKVRFVDVPGGLTAQGIAEFRQTDALARVVGAFGDDAKPKADLASRKVEFRLGSALDTYTGPAVRATHSRRSLVRSGRPRSRCASASHSVQMNHGLPGTLTVSLAPAARRWYFTSPMRYVPGTSGDGSAAPGRMLGMNDAGRRRHRRCRRRTGGRRGTGRRADRAPPGHQGKQGVGPVCVGKGGDGQPAAVAKLLPELFVKNMLNIFFG